jgi:hypothetical protein
MSTTTASPPVRAMPLSGNVDRFKTDPAYQSYTLLRIGFAVAPVPFGVDKFLLASLWRSDHPHDL